MSNEIGSLEPTLNWNGYQVKANLSSLAHLQKGERGPKNSINDSWDTIKQIIQLGNNRIDQLNPTLLTELAFRKEAFCYIGESW